MRFDPEYRPFVAPRCIYIVPLAGDPSRYQVLTPARLTRDLPDLLIQDKLVILRFADCPAEAITNIGAQLRRSCGGEPSRYGVRMNQAIAAGTVLVVLGIVNLTLPDPLPLADEVLMIGGGAGIGLLGYRNRRRFLPLLRRKTGRALEGLDRLQGSADLLLTRIHEAIRARDAKGPGGDASRTGEEVDPFEREARWLVDFLDLQQLLDSKKVTLEHLRSLLEVLAGAFPLARFLQLERRLRSNPGDGRARATRTRIAHRCGMSADAVTVYAEFYRLAREIIDAGGR